MHRQLKAALYFLALIASTLPGCKERTTDGGGFTSASGTVIDSLSGDPIDSARITMVDTLTWTDPVLTDSLGHWEYSYQGTASVTFYCQKEGYLTKQAVVTPVKQDQHLTGIDFALAVRYR